MTANSQPGGDHSGDEFGVTYPRAGVSVVAVRCDLDLLTSPSLDQLLTRELDSGCTGLIVDFSECSFLDSAAIAVLLRLRRSAGQRDLSTSVVFAGLAPSLLRVFDLTGLADVFVICSDMREALATVSL